MIEKFVHKFAFLIAAALIILIALFVGYPILMSNINEAKSIKGVAKHIRKIHDYASEYRRKEGEWPKWDNDHEFLQRFNYRNWLYSIRTSGDTLWVKAVVNPESRVFKKKMWGEYIILDNYGNKTYSHEEFKSKYLLGAYLMDAKKVERK